MDKGNRYEMEAGKAGTFSASGFHTASVTVKSKAQVRGEERINRLAVWLFVFLAFALVILFGFLGYVFSL